MNYLKNATRRRFARFLVAGIINTALNFTVLNLTIYTFHQNVFLAGVVATFCAILCSFALNRTFVFKDKAAPAQKFLRFSLVTTGGTLLIQSTTYALALIFIDSLAPTSSPNFVSVNLSNLIASLTVALWNYNGYRLFVFKGRPYNENATKNAEEFTSETA